MNKRKKTYFTKIISLYVSTRFKILNKTDDRVMADFEKIVTINDAAFTMDYLEGLITFFSENADGIFDDYEYDQKFFLNTLLHIYILLFPENVDTFSYDILKSDDAHLLSSYSKIRKSMRNKKPFFTRFFEKFRDIVNVFDSLKPDWFKDDDLQNPIILIMIFFTVFETSCTEENYYSSTNVHGVELPQVENIISTKADNTFSSDTNRTCLILGISFYEEYDKQMLETKRLEKISLETFVSAINVTPIKNYADGLK